MLSPYINAIQSYKSTYIADDFKFHPVTSSANEIQAQIIKAEDPALKFINLIEEGSVKKAWEEQKKIPSATWLGELVDRIMGWGKYYNEITENSPPQLKRDIHADDIKKGCEIAARPIPFFKNDNFYFISVFSQNILTSLENEKHNNGSCSYNKPESYFAWLRFFYVKNKHTYIFETEDECQSLTTCMYLASRECSTNCFPCISAEGKQLTEESNTDIYPCYNCINFEISSPVIQNLMYTLTVANHQKHVNVWKANQTLQIFTRIIKECEEKETAKYDKVRKIRKEELELRVKLATAGVLGLSLAAMGGYIAKRYFDYTHKINEFKSKDIQVGYEKNKLSWLGSKIFCNNGD
jgi:hypothetical protein